MGYSKKQLRGLLGKGATNEVLSKLLTKIGVDSNQDDYPESIKDRLIAEFERSRSKPDSDAPKPQPKTKQPFSSEPPHLTNEQIAAIRNHVNQIAGEVEGITNALLEEIVDVAVTKSLQNFAVEVSSAFERKLSSPQGKQLISRAEFQIRNNLMKAADFTTVDVDASQMPDDQQQDNT